MQLEHHSDNYAFMYDHFRESGFFIRLSDNTVSRIFQRSSGRSLYRGLDTLRRKSKDEGQYFKAVDMVAEGMEFFDATTRHPQPVAKRGE